MQFQIQVDGPAFSRTVTLDASSAPLVVGRDPSSSLCLPDPDRSISRKHVSLHCELAPVPGVLVTVLSAVSGVSSSRGEIAPGHTLLLRAGDSLQIGPYSLALSEAAGRSGAVQPGRADDPFAALGLGNSSAPSYQDPFQQPEFRAAPVPSTSSADPFEMLMGIANPSTAGKGSFSGLAKQESQGAPIPNMADPMAIFSPASAGSPVNSINSWLGTGGSGGLGASSLLAGLPPPGPSTLARDHVHDINLPLQLPGVAPGNLAKRPSAVAPQDYQSVSPARAIPPQQDDWASLQGTWPPEQPHPSNPPEDHLEDLTPRSSQPISSPSSSNWDGFGSSWLDDFASTPPPQTPMNMPTPLAASTVTSNSGMPDPSASPTQSDSQRATAAQEALCKGLGIASPHEINREGWVTMGKAVRLIVEALSDLMSARAELKRELRSEERTMLHSRNNNPLKGGMSIEELLQYLLFTGSGAGGFMSTEQALKESVDELRTHDVATVTATRAAVEGALREFDPEKLKVVLSKGKKGGTLMPQFLDRSRLWESYEAHYGNRQEHMADWLEQMFNRHFMPAYSKETERLNRLAKQEVPPKGRVIKFD